MVEKFTLCNHLLNFLYLKFKVQRRLNCTEYYKTVSAINFDSSDIV